MLFNFVGSPLGEHVRLKPHLRQRFSLWRGRVIIFVLSEYLFLSMAASANEQRLPVGTFKNEQCMQCHAKIAVHGENNRKTSCVDCHGSEHKDMLVKARQDETCITCHGGQKEPVVHSYATSKHGLILKLEKKEWDWTQPLAQANYRTPGCAYCHMHRGEHNVSAAVRDADLLSENSEEIKSVQDATRRVCQDCHAPRYLTRLFDNGEKMLAIARIKVREANSLLQQAQEQYTAEELKAATRQYQKMQLHLKNVYLGVAHQSPDYQWWHGQPALDGDLLRIKGAISELRRIKNITVGKR